MKVWMCPGQGILGNPTQLQIFQTCQEVYEKCYMEDGILPDAVVGHSLGEIIALYIAGVLDREVCEYLLAQRQRLMDEACKKYPGTMAAVFNMGVQALAGLCDEVPRENGIVQIANFNHRRQLIISGTKDAVVTVLSKAKDDGFRYKVLPVAGAFHSPLMDEANAEFKHYLDQVEFKNPSIKLYSSVDPTQEITSGFRAKELLSEHMVSPVYWDKVINTIVCDGAKRTEDFFEVGGPGGPQYLTGLVEKLFDQGVGA